MDGWMDGHAHTKAVIPDNLFVIFLDGEIG
jgi:hypothetical protein